MALEALQIAVSSDETKECRAWKLFLLLPFMLLRRPMGRGRMGKSELMMKRFDSFAAGKWDELLKEAETETSHSSTAGVPREMSIEQRAKMACQKTRMGEISWARQCLTGATLAPRTEETFQNLQNRRPQEVVRPLAPEVLEFMPDRPVRLDRSLFLASLKSANRGSSPGTGGCTYEHLKVSLDGTDTTEMMFDACSRLAQAKFPCQWQRN